MVVNGTNGCEVEPYVDPPYSSDGEVTPEDLVIGSTDVIFEDGFEKGDTTAWSISVP